MNELIHDLVVFTHAVPDRRQKEFHIACPDCGHPSTPKNPHASFSENGYFCFVCSARYSLPGLARRLGMGDRVYQAPQKLRQEAPRKVYSWQCDAEHLVEEYEAHNARYGHWQGYKPLTRSTIDRMRLGVGVLPACSCHHDRLVVPIIDGTIVVGLRGRRLGCDCPEKWHVAAGTTLDLLPLYNQDALTPGCTVMIVENSVDALLVTERYQGQGIVGVATYSVSYWREAWAETLQAVRPELVIVAYDNDLPGMGGDERREEFIQEWLKSHPRVPEPNGMRLVNKLLAAGLPAHPYRWGKAPYKADIGAAFMV